MKNNTTPISISTLWKSARQIVCLGTLAGLATGSASAAPYYWDPTTATAAPTGTAVGTNGLGSTTAALAAGTWNSAAFWTTTPISTVSGDYTNWAAVTGVVPIPDVIFATGTSNVLGGTVTINGATSVNSLNIQGGRWAFAGTNSANLTIGAGGIVLAAAGGGQPASSFGGDTNFASTVAVTLDGSQTWTNNAFNNSNQIVFGGSVSGNAATGFTNTLTLVQGIKGSGFQFTGSIGDGGGGGNLAIVVNNLVDPLTVTAATSTRLSGTSLYSGKTTVAAGALTFSTITDVFGGGSSLGSVYDVATGTIDLGSTVAGGLIYNGTSSSTSDRVINLAGTTAAGGGVIKNVAATANILTLTGGVTNTGAAGATKTLTLGGTNTGANSIAGVIADGTGADKTAVSKVDAGFWSLNAANSYTGGTTISLGTLAVGASGTLGANVAGNNITIAGGNLLLNADTNVGNLQNLTITSAGGGIGVSYLPTAFPTITDNSGSTGGVFGLNYTGTGGIGSITGISNLFGPSSFWFLGSFVGGTGTYTGAAGDLAVGSGNNYRLGGGGGTLTIQNNILTGAANNLIVGSTGGGTVNLSNGNTYGGTTTLANGVLNVAVMGSVNSASSSIGAQTSAANATINLGSLANAATLNYTGAAASTDRILNFAGTTGTITLGNSGTGDMAYTSAPTFSGLGTKLITLGNGTDAFGGSIGPIKDSSVSPVFKTALTKAGLTNSRWVLTGGAGNTYTGNTVVSGGVLETALASDLAGSFVSISGASGTQFAVWQTQGTITRTVGGTTFANIAVGGNAGFAAKGGTLTVNLGGTLTWASNFGGSGGSPLVFGSTTADNQVIFQNAVDFGTASLGFNRTVYVEKGTGTDSAIMNGVLSSFNVGAVGNNGLVKTGNGTLIISGNNTYSGSTTVSAGTLIAANNVANVVGTAGAFGDGHTSGVNAGTMNLILGDGSTTTNNSSAALLTGGAYTIARTVTVANQATTGTYSVGGATDNNSTFSGLITTNKNLTISQVATTGANTLTISGGIAGATATTKTVTFNNVGRAIVASVGISDGVVGSKIAFTQAGIGVTTLSAANTYTGATTISAGTLLVNGSTAAGSAVALNAGTLGGSGTVGGLVTSAGTAAHIAPGNSPGVLTLSGGLNAASGLTFDFELGTTSDRIDTTTFVGSTAANGLVFNFTAASGFASATPYTLMNFTGGQTGLDLSDLTASVIPAGYTLDTSFGTGGWMINSNNLQVQFFSAVPEPSTYALLIGGLGFLFVLRRKVKKAA